MVPKNLKVVKSWGLYACTVLCTLFKILKGGRIFRCCAQPLRLRDKEIFPVLTTAKPQHLISEYTINWDHLTYDKCKQTPGLISFFLKKTHEHLTRLILQNPGVSPKMLECSFYISIITVKSL